MKQVKRFFKTILAMALLVFLISFQLFFLTACNFSGNSYKSLFTGGSIYDMSMKTVSSLQAQNQITIAQRTSINTGAGVYYATYQEACIAYSAYYNSPSSAAESIISTEIAALVSNWTIFQNLVNSIIPNFFSGTLSLTSVKAPTIVSPSSAIKRGLKFPFKVTVLKTPKGDVISIIVEIAGLIIQYAVPEIEQLIAAFSVSTPTVAQVAALPGLCQPPANY